MKQETEIRTSLGQIEIRKNDDGSESRTVEGYAVVFNSWSHDFGYFKEKVNSRALEGVDMSDVVATFNHDFNMVLARTSAKTMKLEIDTKGLKYSFDAPNTTAGNDLLENIRNGNVSGSSFMFTVAEQRWTWKENSDEVDEREILKVGKLIELGPVTMPAYPKTSAQVRNLYEEAKREKETEPTEQEEPEQVQDNEDNTLRNLKLKIKISKVK